MASQFIQSDLPVKRSIGKTFQRNASMPYTSIQNQNYMKKLLRDNKDEI